MPEPIIGLTTFRHPNARGHPLISINETYLRAVTREGAVPILIPLGLPEASLNQILDHLDGIIFTGGGDVHPDQYGSQTHPKVDDVDKDRDRVELHLVRRVMELRLPFLGICRGLQVINIALGGTLYEDITDQHPGALKHQYYPDWPRDYRAHEIVIQGGSRLKEIIGESEAVVNSLHHQGIRQIAPSVTPVAYAPDGVVEAFELGSYPFGLAVQWHPECLPEDEAMRAIFTNFVRASEHR